MGKSQVDQEVMRNLRDAGATATSEQREQIEALTRANFAEQQSTQDMAEVYGLLGDIGKTALQGLVSAMDDGVVSGNELLGILGSILSQAGSFFLDKAGEGGGVGGFLSDVFAGLFADGGLIPTGGFGIVGEEGPELAFGAPGGTRIVSNPDLMGMLGGGPSVTNNVAVDASGMTPEQASWAISDALDRFSRHVLPGRVADINADPLARG